MRMRQREIREDVLRRDEESVDRLKDSASRDSLLEGGCPRLRDR